MVIGDKRDEDLMPAADLCLADIRCEKSQQSMLRPWLHEVEITRCVGWYDVGIGDNGDEDLMPAGLPLFG